MPKHRYSLGVTPSSNSSRRQADERRKRAGYLYTKPKVGAYYQVKVPQYDQESASKYVPLDRTQRGESSNGDTYNDVNETHDSNVEIALHSNANSPITGIEKINDSNDEKKKPQSRPECVCVYKPVGSYQSNVAKQDKQNNERDEDPVPRSKNSITTTQDENDFLTFVRNIIIQSNPQSDSPNAWLHPSTVYQSEEHTEFSNDGSDLFSVGTGKKRKYTPCSNDMNTYVKPNIFDDSSSDVSSVSTNNTIFDAEFFCGLECDENILQFLHEYGGNVQIAKTAFMIQLSGGVACKTRENHVKRLKQKQKEMREMTITQRKKKRKRDNMNDDDSDEKSLREVVLGSASNITTKPRYQEWEVKMEDVYSKPLGELRPEMFTSAQTPDIFTPSPYDFYLNSHSVIQIERRKKKRKKKKIISLEGADNVSIPDSPPMYSADSLSPKKQWKQFLYSCNEVLKNASVTSGKPLLSQISSLLRSSTSLPTPSVHIHKEKTLEKINKIMCQLLDLYSMGRDFHVKLMDAAFDPSVSFHHHHHGRDGCYRENSKFSSCGIDIDVLKKWIDKTERNCPVILDETSVLLEAWVAAKEWEDKVEDLITSSQKILKGDNDEGKTNVDSVVKNDVIAMVHQLVNDSAQLFLKPKSIVQVKEKLVRAQSLKEKIIYWNNSNKNSNKTNDMKKESVKQITAMVKESKRIGMVFPEILLLQNEHTKINCWIDNATRAHRYRIAMEDLQQVIIDGESLPVDVSDQLNRLRDKLSGANDWINQFESIVACPMMKKIKSDGTEESVPDTLKWLEHIRLCLNDTENKESYKRLLNLAVDGSRIPVDMEALRLLNLEMQVRNWSNEAKRLLSFTGRKAKIHELHEHEKKAKPILSKAPKEDGSSQTKKWFLPHEEELRKTITLSDEWLDKSNLFFGSDHGESPRREHDGIKSAKENLTDVTTTNQIISPSSPRVSIAELQNMVKTGENLPVNLNPSLGKMSRALEWANKWARESKHILFACGITDKHDDTITNPIDPKKKFVTLAQINSVLSGVSDIDIPIDFDDVYKLQEFVDRANKWIEEANAIVPKRSSKRNTRGKNSKLNDQCISATTKSSKDTNQSPEKYSASDLAKLIEEAKSSFHMISDCQEDLERLRDQLSVVQSWKLQARSDLNKIVGGFQILLAERRAFIIAESKKVFPSLPQIDLLKGGSEPSQENNEKDVTGGTVGASQIDSSLPLPDTMNTATVNNNSNVSSVRKIVRVEIPQTSIRVDKKVDVMISNMVDHARGVRIFTIEGIQAEFLTEVIAWCKKVSSVSSSDALGGENHFLSDIKRLIADGNELKKRQLVDPSLTATTCAGYVDGSNEDIEPLLKKVRDSWLILVDEEQERLYELEKTGKSYYEWTEKVQSVVNSTAKITLKDLDAYYNASAKYSANNELVRQIRKKAKIVVSWLNEIRKFLSDETSNISLKEAKSMVSKGDQLGITDCEEVKTLRQQINKSKAWAAKVQKASPEEGKLKIEDVEKLIREHDGGILEKTGKEFAPLKISMPEEIQKLKRAIRGYCLCRNPYEGLMIGCDSCDEWYHCACIGISASQADKCEKYQCIRCVLKKMYKDCAQDALQIVVKWKNPKELNKNRKSALKVHQRKVQKVHSDIAKWKNELQNTTKELDNIREMCQKEQQQLQQTHHELPPQSKPPPSTEPQLQAEEKNNAQTNPSNPNEEKMKMIEKQRSNDVEKANTKIKKINSSLGNCNTRLEKLNEIENRRKKQIIDENKVCHVLHKWFVKVGMNILVPKSDAVASETCPNIKDGTISSPMIAILKEASALKITDFSDVSNITNLFRCLSWCLRALNVLSKKPYTVDIESLIHQCSSTAEKDQSDILNKKVKLPSEKVPKFLRGMIQRAESWRSQVQTALLPCPGETKPYNVSLLKKLHAGARGIPMITLEEIRLVNTIDDNGARHCLCGGPGDGTFMLSCDLCEKWFHGSCVNLDQSAASLESWICPTCVDKNKNISSNTIVQSESSTKIQAVSTIASSSEAETPAECSDKSSIMVDPESTNNNNNHNGDSSVVNTHNSDSSQIASQPAPQPQENVFDPDPIIYELWPPVGLFGEASSKQIIGSDFGSVIKEEMWASIQKGNVGKSKAVSKDNNNNNAATSQSTASRNTGTVTSLPLGTQAVQPILQNTSQTLPTTQTVLSNNVDNTLQSQEKGNDQHCQSQVQQEKSISETAASLLNLGKH